MQHTKYNPIGLVALAQQDDEQCSQQQQDDTLAVADNVLVDDGILAVLGKAVDMGQLALPPTWISPWWLQGDEVQAVGGV